MHMKHRIGYIGYGEMGGGYHWQVANDRDDVWDDLAPTAVYDVREERRQTARERGLRAYDNLEDFLNDDSFDIVVVATPNNFHCKMTCAALRSGRHVICEKPAAMSPEEFMVMKKTADECGKKLFIHQNRRFDRAFLIMKDAIEKGYLGNVYRIESKFCGGEMYGWRAFRDHAGGILYDWGVHLIDQLVYLVDDKVKSVYAQMRNDKNPEVDDRSRVEITFENGVKAEVTVCSTFLAPEPRFVAYGDNGTFWADDHYDAQGTLRYAKSSEDEKIPALAYNDDGAYERVQILKGEDIERIKYPENENEFNQDWAKLYTSMLNTIEGKEDMLVKHEQVLEVLYIIKAAFISSEEGRIVDIDEIRIK